MSSEIMTNEQRKARKSYLCWLCGEEVLPGKEYIYTTWVNDGHFYTSHSHLHCDAMMHAWAREYAQEDELNADDVLYGIWVDICEQICDYEQREKCDMTTALSCELCQRELLDPCILETAIQSVRDNMIDLK